MKQFNLFVIVILVNLVSLPNVYAERKGIVFEATFEEGKDVEKLGFKYSGNKNAEILKAPFLGDSNVLKISLDRLKDRDSYRSEVVPDKIPEPYFKKRQFALYDHDYWYGVRIFVPGDWVIDNDYEIILQWHGQSDILLGESSLNPPIGFMIGKGKAGLGKSYRLDVRGDSKKITPSSGGESRYDYYHMYDLGSIVFDLGKWTEWVFHVRWSYKKEGILEIWKNGKKVLEETNISNAFNDDFGPYWKIGSYKWHWKDRKVDHGFSKRVLYYDDIRIGVGELGASFNDVSPNIKF